MNASILNQKTLQSPLQQQTHIDLSKKGVKARVITATLALTSLVDAFSILVIYLLINTSSATEALDVTKTMNLPKADKTQILDSAVVVRIQDNKYVIEDQVYPTERLVEALQAANKDNIKKGKLIIQANEDIDFEIVNPIFTAGAHAGFENIKFAVWPQNEQASNNDVAVREGP